MKLYTKVSIDECIKDIGKQRIIFPVCDELIRLASVARTNTSWLKVIYCKTIGLLFADVRNLGYNNNNVLIASKNKYINQPRLIYNNKCRFNCFLEYVSYIK